MPMIPARKQQTSGLMTSTQHMMRLRDRPKVYPASKLDMAPVWIELKEDQVLAIDFHARWPGYYGKLEDTPENARRFWLEDIEDVKQADAVLCHAELYHTRPLRGALVEAGAAIALGKPVFIVGQSRCYGTWQWHPLVIHCHTLADACAQIISRWEPIIRKFRMHDLHE